MRAFVLMFVVFYMSVTGIVGCGGGSSTCDVTGNARTFGQCCTENSQCESSVCNEFGDGTQGCTLACTANSDCPEGSKGKKCNEQGFCRI